MSNCVKCGSVVTLKQDCLLYNMKTTKPNKINHGKN